jgi:hypothetical protein
MIIFSLSLGVVQQDMRDAHLIIHPGASHGSPYQPPERVERRVSGFLSEWRSWAH